MYGMKLALGTLGGVGLSDAEQLPLIKAAVFSFLAVTLKATATWLLIL